MSRQVVGVLALQGAFDAHRRVLDRLGIESAEVRSPKDLEGCDRLIMPGGESTTMSRLLETSGLIEPLSERLVAGMPAFGTCAGAILLGSEILDGRADQRCFGAIDIAVRRNAYGRQIDSFEANLVMPAIGSPDVRAIFIRAPSIERLGDDVEVLATVGGAPVVCRQGTVVVATFHPELSGDLRLHDLFCRAG